MLWGAGLVEIQEARNKTHVLNRFLEGRGFNEIKLNKYFKYPKIKIKLLQNSRIFQDHFIKIS